MSFELLLDATGRRRSPAAMPGHNAGHAPRNKGHVYPADPPTVNESVAVVRRTLPDRHGLRLRALIVVLIDQARPPLQRENSGQHEQRRRSPIIGGTVLVDHAMSSKRALTPKAAVSGAPSGRSLRAYWSSFGVVGGCRESAALERPEHRGPAQRRLADHPGEADVCSGIAADRARECSTATERQPAAIPPPGPRMLRTESARRRRSYFRISRLR